MSLTSSPAHSQRSANLRLPRLSAKPIGAAALALPTLAPLLALLLAWLDFDLATWVHLWETLLPEMLMSTAGLVVGVSIVTLALGISLGWLTARYIFPAVSALRLALVLPLAIPSYVLGFVYVGLLDYAGPIQTTLRHLLGEAFEFEVRTLLGAIFVLSLALYPYVYLFAQAAFQEQSAAHQDAARAMGYGSWATFWRIALPLARPSLAAGWALVMMETLTDFAVVRYFNVITLSEGVVRLWVGQMDREAGVQVASLLMGIAFAVVAIERSLRRRARYTQLGSQTRPLARTRLRGWRAWLATGYASLVLVLAFGLPGSQLVIWAIEDVSSAAPGTLEAVFGAYLLNTLLLAGSAALLVILVAIGLGWLVRANDAPSPLLRTLARAAALGYAMPSAVVAIGVLLLLAPLNAPVAAWTGGAFLLSGSLISVLYGYLVRFLAIGMNGVESSLEKISPAMEMAARTLGAHTARVVMHVYLPLMRGGVLTAALLICVDVLKELPLTMFLRPFGMETLSTWAYMLSSESAWVGASTPALVIVGLSLLPTMLLMRRAVLTEVQLR